MKLEMLSDEMLDNVTGGVMTEQKNVTYGMDNDPLFKRFQTLMEGEKKDGVTGMESRAEFLSKFRRWVSEGKKERIPDSSGKIR